MQFLFERGFSKSLVGAIGLVLDLDKNGKHTVAYYDKEMNEGLLDRPVIFLFDESKRGVDPTTKRYAEEHGCLVFAYKRKSDEKPTMFESALTMMRLFPKALELAQKSKEPFLYTFRCKAKTFSEVKLKN